MTHHKGMLHTNSEQKILYTTQTKATIQLTLRFRIEKVGLEHQRLWSKSVSSGLEPRAVWMLEVRRSADWLGAEQFYVLLHLTGPMANKKESLKASYHVYLVGGVRGEVDSIYREDGATFNSDRNYWKGYGKAVSQDRLRKALQANGSLVVAADTEYLAPDDGGSTKAIYESAIQGYEDQQRWASKFSELHGDEVSSDCTIEIGGVSIPAHKSILMAHSPIIRSMFTHPEAEEYQSGTIRITDIKEPEPMRALIRYCYRGRLDAATMDGEWAVEIFKLADRYCIKELKTQLERHFIEKQLSAKNVVAMAVLAGSYTGPKLEQACAKLIAREWKTIYGSADWKAMKEANPKLAADLAEAAIAEK